MTHAAPTADTNGLSTTATAALQTLFGPANAAAQEIADLTNCDRPMATCDVCSEPYFRGTCSTPRLALGHAEHRLFCYHDEAPYRYWKHVRESTKHQYILQIHDINMSHTLADLDTTISTAKVQQKLMRNPAYAPLREAFR